MVFCPKTILYPVGFAGTILGHWQPLMYAGDTHLTFTATNVHDIDLNLNQDFECWCVDRRK